MKALDDTKIIDLFFERDETAIRYASEKYGNRLRSLSHSIVKDRQTAEECENDTYMEAWDTIPPHEPRSYLYAFLARIIRHLSLNCCRDRSRLKSVVLILLCDKAKRSEMEAMESRYQYRRTKIFLFSSSSRLRNSLIASAKTLSSMRH